MDTPILLWRGRGSSAPERSLATGPVPLELQRSGGRQHREGGGTRAPVVVPVDSANSVRRAALAVLVVPPEFRGRVMRDGLSLPAGLHLLSHGTRLDFDGVQLWVSASAEPLTIQYDGSGGTGSGGDARCARTKVRLEPGETVVRCPGTPSRDCGLLYRETVWDASLACRHCGYDPETPEWRPTVAPEGSHLDALIDLARRAS